ncbi:MAG: hypothetical protein KF878_30235 [Planctomycetes bacterium]|nr:hypothetical protein [Planctomycetota bacterium]
MRRVALVTFALVAVPAHTRAQDAAPVVEVGPGFALLADGAPVTTAALAARLDRFARDAPPRPHEGVHVIADGALPWRELVILFMRSGHALIEQTWSVAGGEGRITWRIPQDTSAGGRRPVQRWSASVRFDERTCRLRWRPWLQGGGAAPPAGAPPGNEVEGTVDQVVAELVAARATEVVLDPAPAMAYRDVHATALAISRGAAVTISVRVPD